MACGSADGSIVVVRIAQFLKLSDFSISVSAEIADTPFGPTRRSTGSLRWITLADSNVSQTLYAPFAVF
jgi:hypothetical protein